MARRLPLKREDQLASQEIVRAQDQRSSSIEVFSGPGAAADRPRLLDWARNRTRVSATSRSCRSQVAAWRGLGRGPAGGCLVRGATAGSPGGVTDARLRRAAPAATAAS